jgi:hypothetical protein
VMLGRGVFKNGLLEGEGEWIVQQSGQVYFTGILEAGQFKKGQQQELLELLPSREMELNIQLHCLLQDELHFQLGLERNFMKGPSKPNSSTVRADS